MSRSDPTPETAPPTGRRAFLKAAGLAGLGGAAAAALPEAARSYEPPSEQVEARYRRNAHVERFYFLNRL